jgi:hypothetical protein
MDSLHGVLNMHEGKERGRAPQQLRAVSHNPQGCWKPQNPRVQGIGAMLPTLTTLIRHYITYYCCRPSC